MVSTLVRATGLLVLGFAGGILSLFGYHSATAATASPTLASADTCITDTESEEDDVFFLGCGGIF